MRLQQKAITASGWTLSCAALLESPDVLCKLLHNSDTRAHTIGYCFVAQNSDARAHVIGYRFITEGWEVQHIYMVQLDRILQVPTPLIPNLQAACMSVYVALGKSPYGHSAAAAATGPHVLSSSRNASHLIWISTVLVARGIGGQQQLLLQQPAMW